MSDEEGTRTRKVFEILVKVRLTTRAVDRATARANSGLELALTIRGGEVGVTSPVLAT